MALGEHGPVPIPSSPSPLLHHKNDSAIRLSAGPWLQFHHKSAEQTDEEEKGERRGAQDGHKGARHSPWTLKPKDPLSFYGQKKRDERHEEKSQWLRGLWVHEHECTCACLTPDLWDLCPKHGIFRGEGMSVPVSRGRTCETEWALGLSAHR